MKQIEKKNAKINEGKGNENKGEREREKKGEDGK